MKLRNGNAGHQVSICCLIVVASMQRHDHVNIRSLGPLLSVVRYLSNVLHVRLACLPDSCFLLAWTFVPFSSWCLPSMVQYMYWYTKVLLRSTERTMELAYRQLGWIFTSGSMQGNLPWSMSRWHVGYGSWKRVHCLTRARNDFWIWRAYCKTETFKRYLRGSLANLWSFAICWATEADHEFLVAPLAVIFNL